MSESSPRINTDQSRFEMTVDGHEAFLTYTISDGVMALNHTEVAPELSGRGVGKQIVLFALDHARAKDLRVAPNCGFVRKTIDRHPEYEELVAG